MSILTNFRNRVLNFLQPQKNSMSLPNEYMRYGNKRTIADWSEVTMSDQDHYTGYGYAAIRNRANGVAKLASNNARTESNKEGIQHPYLDLIYSSTDFTEYGFWSEISTYLDLEGVYYLMAVRAVGENKVGGIQKLKLLNPYNVRRVLSPDKLEITGYVETKKGMLREIPKEMIIEIRELNPFTEDFPYAMTDAAKDSQFTLKTAGNYTRHAIKGNINAPGILSTDVILPDQDFQNFASRVRSHTKGEPIFGNGTGGITWQSMTQSLRESALEVVNEVNRDQLFAVSGVSKTLMGIEQSGTTRETARIQKDLSIEMHLLPRVQLILDSLNLDYAKYYGNKTNPVYLVVDNPNATDIDASKKETEWKKAQYDLFVLMTSQGYDSVQASAYIAGKIELDQLKPPIPSKQASANSETLEKTVNTTDPTDTIILHQQGALQNAIVNIEGKTTATVINRIRKKFSKTAVNEIKDPEQLEEIDIITKYEKKGFANELALVLATFYGIVFSLQGQTAMQKRSKEYNLPADFNLDKEARNYIKKTADSASKSHIDTISSDLFRSARENAIKGASVEEIVSEIKRKYSDEITEQRAKTIARTETKRAFTRSQYEADRQFIKQNKLEGRVYKQWITRSAMPCEFCIEMASRPPIPFSANFADLGDNISAEGKTLSVGFEDLEAGNLHPNCQCDYRIIIEPAKNQLDAQRQELENEKEKVKLTKEELDKLQEDIRQIIKSV